MRHRLALAFVLVSACDRRPPRRLDGPTGAIKLQGDTAIPALRLVEESHFGGRDEDLYSTSQVAITRSGALVLGRPRDNAVTIYSPDMKHHTSAGRTGSGPGEVSRLDRIGTVGDTVWMSDFSTNRINFFAADGKFLDSESMHFGFSMPQNWGRHPLFLADLFVYAVYSDGDYLVRGTWGDLLPPNRAKGSALFRISPFGWIKRRLATTPSLSERGATITVGGADRLSSASAVAPFVETVSLVTATNGTRFGYHETHFDRDSGGGTIKLVILDQEGDTVISRAFTFVGEPIPQRAIDSAVAATALRLTSYNTALSTALAAKYRREAPGKIPPYYAPIKQLVLGRDSTAGLLLRRVGAKRRLLLLDARGDLVGTAQVPVDFRIVDFARDRLLAVSEDDDGFETFTWYRLERDAARPPARSPSGAIPPPTSKD